MPELSQPPAHDGQHTREVLIDWGIDAERVDALIDPRRREAGVMGTLVVFHAHPDDEAIATGGSMARAHAEGHRVVLVVATDGEHGEVPDDLADGETLVDRRRAETERSAAALGVDRLVWLGYADSGMTGWEANLERGVVLEGRRRRSGARDSPTILREERPTCLPSTTGTETTAIPTTSRSTRSAVAPRRWWPTNCPACACSRRR